MAAQIHSVKDFELMHSLELSQLFVVPCGDSASGRSHSSSAASPTSVAPAETEANRFETEARREKSMGIMSQRFLMLFLTSPVSTS